MPVHSILLTAFKIAQKDLSACLHPLGILAGLHHYTDIWARDSLFAAYGANIIGRYEFTKKTLETLLTHQRSDGLVPYRILRSPTTLGKYLGKAKYYKQPKADFRSHQSAGIIPDGGLLTIISAKVYIEVSRDLAFLPQFYPQLKRAINWYIKRFPSQLISEWFLCEWADAILKLGKTLYTNVLYYHALASISWLAKQLKEKNDERYFRQQASLIKNQINHHFWTEGYFVDWIDYKKQPFFATLPNLLSIWFNLADKKQAEAILSFIQKYCQNTFTLETNYPTYPAWRIPLWNYLTGMADYHNRGCLWLQPGIVYTLALLKVGKIKEAKIALESIARQIIKYKGVYEVYEKEEMPVRRFFYRSEYPFAWSAGLYLYAYHQLRKSRGKSV